ncbi:MULTISPECIES: M20/M25/M40 family metallo-hydrolase [Niastella]|uniref:M20/M25/M40 family metallo-hydrolase n=1 Tax=Niastella soli TaxID=2821487 RepID=A0ABS3YQH3_9BACT|nr:M20/M25/M40 family metallo-hydrolase [Niastella soli]MBO9199827.1 M20/M25/M40 family metallo-hydrolase [Niastella soli]
MRLLIILLLSSFTSVGQKLKKADKVMITNLQAHIMYLADDKLEGRRAGTNGEKLAYEYIRGQFQKAGLEPKGEQGWLQPFEINDGKQVNAATLLFINDHELKLNDEYFPFVFCPTASLDAAVSPAVKEKGVPWFDDLKDIIEDNKENPHFDLSNAIKIIAQKAAEKGATALFVYNTSGIADNLKFEGKDNSNPSPLPVVYLTAKACKEYLADESATLDIRLKTVISDKKRTGNNVIGIINNGAPNTIIFGAHYDHLGYGEDGNSMLRTGERQIHNGADDNASGTAALIELARSLKGSKDKNNNYVFIAFSGEELGLFGSKYFTEHPTIDLTSVNFMVNMDMVGRLNDSSKTITVGGYGTSPTWGPVFTSLSKQKYFTIKYDSSGIGPSDHTSFYLKNIPVLFFFTGLHSDYHKPTDDYNKINFTGEAFIVKYIESLVDLINSKGKLAFQKTREPAIGTTARFNVTLGIMPDYTFSGSGVRVDGVTDGRPAQKAGIQTGDIIIQLGSFNTNSLETYMQALSKFNKGDKTTVRYKRGEEMKEGPVEF